LVLVRVETFSKGQGCSSPHLEWQEGKCDAR
jgi:hypothetical protein